MAYSKPRDIKRQVKTNAKSAQFIDVVEELECTLEMRQVV
jgi:hypothetical protein